MHYGGSPPPICRSGQTSSEEACDASAERAADPDGGNETVRFLRVFHVCAR